MLSYFSPLLLPYGGIAPRFRVSYLTLSSLFIAFLYAVCGLMFGHVDQEFAWLMLAVPGVLSVLFLVVVCLKNSFKAAN